MDLEILNVKQVPLTDSDIRSIVDIEFHPKTREWLIERLDNRFKEAVQAYEKFFRNLSKHKRADILVAKSGGRVVGFLGLRRLGMNMKHIASIGISVHPDHWGKGIGTRLTNRAIELARERIQKT